MTRRGAYKTKDVNIFLEDGNLVEEWKLTSRANKVLANPFTLQNPGDEQPGGTREKEIRGSVLINKLNFCSFLFVLYCT